MRGGCRVEKKYIVSLEGAAVLRQRLAPFMEVDPQTIGGVYRIRSLYFDTLEGDAFWEKFDGEAERHKYRLRFYNGNDSFIRLEKKEKIGDLTRKTQARVDRLTAQAMQRGEYDHLASAEDPLCRAFYAEARTETLVPAVTVEYLRTPFIYRIDNVRITIDTEIYAGSPLTFFLPGRTPFPVLENGMAILEVKTDDRLPAVLGRVLETVPRQQQSFSKYALSLARLRGIE